MAKNPILDFTQEIEEQLLIGTELEKYNAKKFLNLLSDMVIKYEPTILEKFDNKKIGA